MRVWHKKRFAEGTPRWYGHVSKCVLVVLVLVLVLVLMIVLVLVLVLVCESVPTGKRVGKSVGGVGHTHLH